MSLVRCIVLIAQSVLTGVAVLMSLWAGMSSAGALGLGLLGVSAMGVTVPDFGRRVLVGRWGLAGAWAGTLIALGSVLLTRNLGRLRALFQRLLSCVGLRCCGRHPAGGHAPVRGGGEPGMEAAASDLDHGATLPGSDLRTGATAQGPSSSDCLSLWRCWSVATSGSASAQRGSWLSTR